MGLFGRAARPVAQRYDQALPSSGKLSAQNEARRIKSRPARNQRRSRRS